jgi:adenylate kinase
MEAILLMGGPGAGKGTAAEGLRDRANLIHVSTGDMFRAAVKSGSAVGRRAEDYMKRGALVPDDLVIRIVQERLDQGADSDRFLLDGFPRTMVQAELLDTALQQRNARIRCVFYLEASREVLIRRLGGRRICRACGATFHLVNIPPKREGVCDQCGGELYQRADDREETIVHRLEVFAGQMQDLIRYYDKRGVLIRIDAGGTPDITIGALLGFLNR